MIREKQQMMDVSDIKLIKKVAELGSINKAADELFMSQPTLSKRISRLEQNLNVKLFYRHSSGMQPTEVADYLIQNGQLVQAKLDSMVRHVERLASLEGGTLNVGVGPIIEQLYYPDVLLAFVKATNNIQMQLKTANSNALLKMIIDGHIDIAVGPFNKEALPDDLVCAPLQGAPVIFAAKPSHPLIGQSNLNWNDIMAYPKICPRAEQSTTIPGKHKSLIGSLRIACDNYTTAISLVQNSDFITAGPRLLFQQQINDGTLAEIPFDADIHWQSSWIAKREAVYTPAVEKFIELLQTHRFQNLD